MATMKTLNGYGFNATELNGKAPEYYLQPRNLLDNSDFRNPVNQRGQTDYTNNGYTIDRWELYSGAVGVSSLGYITTSGQMYQKIAIPTDKVYTFAIENDSGIALVTGIPANGIRPATLGNALIKLATIGGYVEVVIEPSEGYNVAGAYWAALYEGSYTVDTLPPYVPKGYAAELAECRIYYRTGTERIARPFTSGNLAYLCEVSYEIPMRANPNVSIKNIRYWASQSDAGISAIKNISDRFGFNSISLSSSVSDNIIQFDYESTADL